MTDEQGVDPDAVLNHLLAIVVPHRERARAAGSLAEVNRITGEALREAQAALGPVGEDLAFALLLAAVLRLADIWIDG